jgi:hypothetical protein
MRGFDLVPAGIAPRRVLRRFLWRRSWRTDSDAQGAFEIRRGHGNAPRWRGRNRAARRLAWRESW